MKISRIDHIVLTVKDIDVTVKFYESVMGMEKETFGEGRVALKFGSQKINLHPFIREFEPDDGHEIRFCNMPEPRGVMRWS